MKYLIALPTFPNQKGFNCETILISAESESEAYSKAGRLRPNKNLGDIKKVDY